MQEELPDRSVTTGNRRQQSIKRHAHKNSREKKKKQSCLGSPQCRDKTSSVSKSVFHHTVKMGVLNDHQQKLKRCTMFSMKVKYTTHLNIIFLVEHSLKVLELRDFNFHSYCNTRGRSIYSVHCSCTKAFLKYS